MQTIESGLILPGIIEKKRCRSDICNDSDANPPVSLQKAEPLPDCSRDTKTGNVEHCRNLHQNELTQIRSVW